MSFSLKLISFQILALRPSFALYATKGLKLIDLRLLPTWKFLVAIAVAVMSPVLFSFASSNVRGHADASRLPITVYMLEEPSGMVTISDITETDVGLQFKRLKTPSILGYGKNIWLELKSDQPLKHDLEYWLDLQSPLLDEARLYQKTSSGHIVEYPPIGTEHPYANRGVRYRSPTHIVKGEEGKRLALYLNMRGNNSMVVNPAFMLPQNYFAEATRNDLLVTALIMLTLGSSFICVWLGISLRNRAYILLAAWIFINFLRLASMTGVSYQYLLHDIPGSTDLIIFGSWATGAAVMDAFALCYIGAWNAWFKWARLYLILASVSALMIAAFIMQGYQIAIQLGSVLYVVNDVLLMGAVVWQAAKGSRAAKTLLLAFCAITLGASLQVGYFWGYATDYAIAKYGYFIGLLVMIAVLIYAAIKRQQQMLRSEGEAKTRELERHKQIEQELEYEVSKRTAALKDAMKRLADSLSIEQQARQDQRRFMMMLSHELRTPLALIDSAAMNIELDLSQASEALRLRCGRIRKTVSQMTSLIESSMNRKRYLNGANEVAISEVDVYGMIYEAHDAARAISTQHEFQIEMKDFPETLNCDAAMTTLVLRTLASNAVTYTPVGTKVTFAGRLEDGGAILEVIDNGPGVHPDDFPRIFERYYRGRNATSNTGTGLGLALAREMIESQGGLLTAINNPGKGFAVRIWLPVQSPRVQ